MSKQTMVSAEPGVRLDKWLWAARFFKTRSVAVDEIARNRVQVNGAVAKASREVRPGDHIELRQGQVPKTVRVIGISDMRGPAPVAQRLYEETADSVTRRQALAEQRRFAGEPSHTIEAGRPTKRDRRQLADWHRWSASVEPE